MPPLWAGAGVVAAPEAGVCSADVLHFAGHGVPFGIIFGGTDLNEDVNDGEKNQAMGRVLQEARYYLRASEAVDAGPVRMQVRGDRRWALPDASPWGQRDGGGSHSGGSHLTREAHFLLSVHFFFLSLGRSLFCSG